MKISSKTLAIILCLVVTSIFSFHYLIAKQILSAGVSPYSLSSWRGLLGGGILLLFFHKKVNLEILIKNKWVLASVAFLGFFINQIFFMKGLSLTTPLTASILTNTIPIVTSVIAFLFGLEKSSKRKSIGVAISFIFVCIFIFKGSTENIYFYNIGNTYIFLNVLAFCVAMVLGKKLLTQNFPYEVLTATMLFGGGILMAFMAGSSMLDMYNYAIIGKIELLNVLFEILVSTSIVYLLNLKALSILSATKVSIFIYFQPMITAASDYFIYNNGQNLESFIYFCGIIIGAYLVVLQRSNE